MYTVSLVQFCVCDFMVKLVFSPDLVHWLDPSRHNNCYYCIVVFIFVLGFVDITNILLFLHFYWEGAFTLPCTFSDCSLRLVIFIVWWDKTSKGEWNITIQYIYHKWRQCAGSGFCYLEKEWTSPCRWD